MSSHPGFRFKSPLCQISIFCPYLSFHGQLYFCFPPAYAIRNSACPRRAFSSDLVYSSLLPVFANHVPVPSRPGSNTAMSSTLLPVFQRVFLFRWSCHLKACPHVSTCLPMAAASQVGFQVTLCILVYSKTRGESLQLTLASLLFTHFHWVSWSARQGPNAGACPSSAAVGCHPASLTLFLVTPCMEWWKCSAELENSLMFFLHNFCAPLSLLFSLLGTSFIFPSSPLFFAASLPVFLSRPEAITLMTFPSVLSTGCDVSLPWGVVALRVQLSLNTDQILS